MGEAEVDVLDGGGDFVARADADRILGDAGVEGLGAVDGIAYGRDRANERAVGTHSLLNLRADLGRRGRVVGGIEQALDLGHLFLNLGGSEAQEVFETKWEVVVDRGDALRGPQAADLAGIQRAAAGAHAVGPRQFPDGEEMADVRLPPQRDL